MRWSMRLRRRRPATRFKSARAVAGARGERAGKPLAKLVEPLQHGREERLRLRPAANGQLEALAAALDAPRQAMPRPVRELAELSRAARRAPARRSRRRRSASARAGRRRSRQGRVGLVADRGDERDRRVGDGAHHLLLVERPQILDRAAAAGDDQQVGPRLDRRQSRESRAAILAAAPSPCTGTGHTMTWRRAAVREAVEDVADHRAGRRGDDADHARQERQLALARLVEQAFRGERPAALLEQAPAARPRPASSIRSTTIWYLRSAGIGGELARRDHLDAVLGTEGERCGARPARSPRRCTRSRP